MLASEKEIAIPKQCIHDIKFADKKTYLLLSRGRQSTSLTHVDSSGKRIEKYSFKEPIRNVVMINPKEVLVPLVK